MDDFVGKQTPKRDSMGPLFAAEPPKDSLPSPHRITDFTLFIEAGAQLPVTEPTPRAAAE